jgi:hypothetical protein
MKIIELPYRRFDSNLEYEDAFYVILPMEDETYLDSIIRISGKNLYWKFEPNGDQGNHYMKLSNLEHTYPTNSNFVKYLSENYPNDLEFFIWHSEIFEGKYYGGKE